METAEQKSSFSKFFVQLIKLILIDYVVIWLWVRFVDPDSSISIILIFAVPFVFGLNIVIGIVVAVAKTKTYFGLFFINAFISSILMYILFSEGIDRNMNNRYDSWNFDIKDTTFEIRIDKIDKTFDMFHQSPGTYSIGFLGGSIRRRQNQYLLISDSIRLRINNEMLYGFRGRKISLTKYEY